MSIKLLFGAFLIGLLSTTPVHSQTILTPGKEKLATFGIDGMIGVSIGEKTIGINVGGPSLKFRIHNVKIGVGAMPSLFIRDDRAVPRLAVGPLAEWKHWMLIVPYYGYDANDRQIWTFGLGYKMF